MLVQLTVYLYIHSVEQAELINQSKSKCISTAKNHITENTDNALLSALYVYIL